MTKTKSQKARARAARMGAPRPLPKGGKSLRKKVSSGFVGPLLPMQVRRRGPKSRPVGMRGDLVNVKGSSGRIGLSSSNVGALNRRTHIIEEDEYIAEINGSVGFAVTSYPVNIGQSGTFPWGSTIAKLYEKYNFEFLEFYYRREVSEFATNGQSGKVMLSCDYDASDSPPASKQQVLDTVPHVDGMPCVEILVLKINPREARAQDSKYVRPGAQPASTDIKTYDLGNLYVSTYGCTNTNVIGELRVRYRCQLKVPVLEAGLVAGFLGSFYHTIPSSSSLIASPVQQIGSNLSAVLTATTVTLPVAGRYLITVYATSGTTVTKGGDPTAGAGCTFQLLVQAGSGTSTYMIQIVADFLAGGVLNLPAPTVVGALQGGSLYIVEIPSALLPLVEEEKQEEELTLLKEQVKEMGKMMRSLLVSIPNSPEEKDIEIINSVPPSTPEKRRVFSGLSPLSQYVNSKF